MSIKDNLENLARSGGLKAEPPDHKECEGLLRSAIDRLKDAHNPALSFASRFDLAYNAAHAPGLTALRLCKATARTSAIGAYPRCGQGAGPPVRAVP